MIRRTLFAAKLRQHALDAGASPAMVMPGREYSHAELLDHVENCAAWLSGRGCRLSEVVGVTIADEYTHMVASLALLELGVPQVCLPTHDPVAMRRHLTQRLPVSRVIVTDMRQALPDREALLLTPEILAARDRAESPGAVDDDPDAPAIFFTSSGTTGEQKVFAMSQRALAWRAERMVESEAMASGFRALVPASVENPPAKAKRLYTSYLGLTSVFQASTSPRVSAQAFCASYARDVSRIERSAADAASCRTPPTTVDFPDRTSVYASGSRVPASLRQAFRDRFARPFFIHYGAREFGRIATTYLGDYADTLESVGTPAPWVELEIADAGGRALPTGEVGELRVRVRMHDARVLR